MRKLIGAVLALAAIAVGAYFFRPADEAQAASVVLYKNPQCGCCSAYADYLRDNGFTVEVKPTHDLVAMSSDAGIPEDFQGCHLSYFGDRVVSGHVPVEIVNRFLKDDPAVKAITLPGMPAGSPGMGGAKTEPFTVYRVGNGKPQIYSSE